MKFRVTGENVSTAARMTMEIEASSKAEAERKAFAAGMKVHHAAPLSDEDLSAERRGRPRAAGLHPVLKLVVLVALLAAAYLLLWPRLRPMLGR